ncbi:hypothetical protein OG762_34145 [Streptomyces sp. NBC_01136]|uniref:hypothetical protein n=1 Tax=unclassified Streptomyces TaxID=2593676 RepID=UPI00324FC6A6|nr:hypothetical protein OG762_34145 [Streptomyces sp. NBC_01136]
MPETSDARRRSQLWSAMLPHTTPKGWVAPQGTPQRLIAETAAREAAPEMLFDPVLVPEGVLSEELLKLLLDDAVTAEARSGNTDGHRVAMSTDETLDRFRDFGVIDWCEKQSGIPMDAALQLVFLYYEAGDTCPAHFDTHENFQFNFLLCLGRTRVDGGKSTATYFFDADGGLWSRDLSFGEAVWFHARKTVHGRTPLAPGERVVLASLGMHAA